ncbi:acyl-CoA dehydrogenase family protein [Streptomyces scopuliridis]|uniref:Acyl-CoA dehydrogenase family protein n=1 Tax=Streptomyces scopuliridis TaxID=452529 RepID=A0ACD4ZTZ5_9ACTN|nr:acyl-CoA dehydrogenase family protein [Streptomyces scopuliridis]WSC01705.1 acyl-CoA dehydrogenase family protein [Streptomyces scopuliridis]WSC04756.1 acyl-CoA dehydrogenase family protein [Streptomyces scopuliridis]
MAESYLEAEHRTLRDTVRAFAQKPVARRIPAWEKSRRIERDIPRRCARKGWIGATIPAEYGGMAIGHLGKTLMLEELSRVSAAMGMAVQASQLGVAKILHLGSEAQKKSWLPKIAAGTVLPTIAVTEPGSGGHVLGMEATARRVGDDYLLNGTKVFVGNSHIGNLHGVVVRTGPGSKGLSAFLVEADRPGLTLGRLRPSMGLHGFAFGELRFDNCRIPAANLLGNEGDGLDVAYSSSVLYGRLNLAAVALGINQAIYETTIEVATTRHRYGKPLSELPTVRHKIGLMLQQLMTARLTAYHAADLLDQGLPCDAELMSAKYLNTESAIDAARTSMEIHAAEGLSTEQPLERYTRDAFHTYAPAGTSDIQLLRLAETALAIPGSERQWSQRFATRQGPRHARQHPGERHQMAVHTPLDRLSQALTPLTRP